MVPGRIWHRVERLALDRIDCQGYGTMGNAMTPAAVPIADWWRAFRRWPRAARDTVYGLVALVVLALVVVTTVVVLVERPMPQTTGTIDVPGLSHPVTVVRDAHGIPQLYGDSVEDLMRAEGYVHAQERFYEMDVRRHLTAGRLSELFGRSALDTDEFVRTLGWREVAEKELALLTPRTRAAFEAYAAGVNAYLDQHSPAEISVEYSVLGAGGLDYRPEPWTPADSVAWLKAMAWDLRGNIAEEIQRLLAASMNPPAQVAELDPPYDETRAAPIVSQGAVVDGVFDQDATGGTRLPRRPAPVGAAAVRRLAQVGGMLDRLPPMIGKGDGIGSNSWVVDGAHTTTGAPLLANDPHLGVSLPGPWMQVGLHCRTVSSECPLDVAGFSFSGLPGVVIGHNADIAWGFTNLGPDVSDLYLEKVQGDEVRYDGRMRPLRVRTETIEVRDGADVTLTVRSTRHGPLISDVADDYADIGNIADPDHGPPGGYAVALAWTALRPSRTADAILALDTATDWSSFRQAVADFAVPGQNIVYADRAGHIGYQATGRVPIRKSGNDGYLPAEGWRPDDDWTGDYVPFQGLPSVLDPDEGFVVTANQEVIGGDYPYHLTDDWDHGYRSARIRTLLQDDLDGGGRVSPADMAAAQLDDRNPFAQVLVPHLLSLRLPRGYYADGQALLRRWDLHQGADSAAAAYFNVVWRYVLALTFDDDLPEGARPSGGERWYAVVENLLTRPDDAFWDDRDTGEVETRDDVLTRAMLAARDAMTRRQSRLADGWTWGHLHRLDLQNQTLGTSGVGPVERLLNRGGWEVGGGTGAVDATAWNADQGYRVTNAPSMRMVVDLADLDRSRWINLTGVSGHAFNSHYTDQTDLWAGGRTLPWPFTRAAVDAAADDVLTLEPAFDPSGG